MYDPNWKDNPNRVNPPDDDGDVGDPYVTHEEICEYLKDPLKMWESISDEAFKPPHNAYDARGSVFLNAQNQIAEEKWNNAIHQAFVDEDFYALGELIMSTALEHAEHQMQLSR